MRLHHLTLSAFGPFAGTEEVGFDELCEAGLFLLTGPTGAGKTTILDAVCFALYGSVPGVRGVKSLKSQHAGDDARPEVVLDFSVRDRRFVVRRSPEWSRPKRRGTGLTTENARATLVETTSGEDHLLSSRAQEVGHFVGELIGMQPTQFVQVAMLPQGEFQRFLRASSQDRHDVLQHLFRTDRYARIEEWVHDHSRQLKERSTTGRQAVVRALDNVADRVTAELPDIGDDGLPTAEAHDGALSWVDEHVAAAAGAHAAAADQQSAAAGALRAARAALEDGLRLRDLHMRRDDARSALDRLAGDASGLAGARLALDADARASRCLPLLRLLADARVHREHSSRTWAVARADLATAAADGIVVPDRVTAAELAELEQEARSSAARLEGLLPREQELLTARAAVLATTAGLDEATALRTEATSRAKAIPPQLGEARASAARLGTVAARVESLSLEVEQARGRLEAAQQAADCAASLPLLRDAERGARDASADARDVMQDLTARRLAGIAAELAGKLVPGEACQVCGSTDHPAPATSPAAPVGQLEQEEAAAAYEAAGVALAAASGAVGRAEERLEGLRAAAGHQSAEAAAATLGRLEDALAEAVRAEAGLGPAEALVEALTSEQQELTARVHDLALRVAGLAQSLEAHRRTIEVTSAELESQVDTGVPVRDQVTRLVDVADAFAVARGALSAHDAAATKVDELMAHADAAAREEGFADRSSVQAAVLTDDDRAHLAGLIEAMDRTEAAARTTLEEEAVRGLGDSPVPDLTALADALRAAEDKEGDTTRRRHQTAEVLESLRRQRARLVDALTTWAPLREEYLRAESMSKLVRGTGGDNQLQMRLSAYVLATRLDQVVAAANERLGHMRDQRFLLQRTGRAARKGAQAGLGLEVVDQWTGDVREPTTLSGGETFVVSLALALGLADVVTQEAGGTEIETLFVDEGFGTLDADTLDDVMDRLDDLRAGGRAVGVVSHVSELRNRIPTQLHVEKGRTGSVVTVRTAVG